MSKTKYARNKNNSGQLSKPETHPDPESSWGRLTLGLCSVHSQGSVRRGRSVPGAQLCLCVTSGCTISCLLCFPNAPLADHSPQGLDDSQDFRG